MASRVRITDVSPRDGLQNEPGVIPTSEKYALIESLCAAGLDEVELTSFVSPKWVPQLADAAELIAMVRELHDGLREVAALSSRLAPEPLPTFSVLVPNAQGFEKALAFHNEGLPLKIALFTAASETFSQRNTNASIAQTLERFAPIVLRAISAGMPLRLYISCAVACPFEGPIAQAAVRSVADRLLELAPDDASRARMEIDLGDTVGVAHPRDIDALLSAFDPDLRQRQLTLHLHDTFSRAASCVRAALDMGVVSFDGAMGGLGGCPYAGTPQRRAPGNIDTDLLVRTVREAGFTTSVDAEHLARAGEIARRIASRSRDQAGAPPQGTGGPPA